MTAKPIPEYTQPELLSVVPDIDFGGRGSGSARTHYGAAAQQIATALLNLVPIANSGAFDVVFDAGCPRTGSFVEIKSVFHKGQAPVYLWRLRKEEPFSPVYAFLIHRVRNAPTLRSCYEQMAAGPLTIALLNHRHVHCMAGCCKTRQIVKEGPRGTRKGSQRRGYCEGYVNLPVRDVLGRASVACWKAQASLHGMDFEAQVICGPDVPLCQH